MALSEKQRAADATRRLIGTENYKTVAGETIEYSATPEERAFLSKVMHDANDPRVSEAKLVELIYGKENPLLDQTILPGRGAVTRAALANPLYHVMLDLLDAKRISFGSLALNVGDAFTLTVAEAAHQLQVTPGAVRQAIAAGTLTATKRGPTYFVDPRSVEVYRTSHVRRGPAASPALRLRFGNKEGASFRVKFPEITTLSKEGHISEGEVALFKRGAIAFSGEGKNRVFIVEPAETPERFSFSGFFIEGKFRVVAKVNNPEQAASAFKMFKAE